MTHDADPTVLDLEPREYACGAALETQRGGIAQRQQPLGGGVHGRAQRVEAGGALDECAGLPAGLAEAVAVVALRIDQEPTLAHERVAHQRPGTADLGERAARGIEPCPLGRGGRRHLRRDRATREAERGLGGTRFGLEVSRVERELLGE